MTTGSGAAKLPAAAGAVVERYLATLATALPVPRRTRSQILAELDDGLRCAIEDHLHGGEAPLQAAEAAVRELGDPQLLAREYAAELAPATARRIGLCLVLSGPAVGLTWVLTCGVHVAGWTGKIGAVMMAAPFMPFLLAVAVPSAVVASAARGRLARFVGVSRDMATNAATVAVTACVLADIALVATAASTARAVTGTVGLAVALSGLRSCLAAVGLHRLARLRAAAS